MANGTSLSSILTHAVKKIAAKKIGKAASEEREKAGFLSGILSLLKPISGALSKKAMIALGIGSGGLLTPLLMGLGTSGISKIFKSVGERAFGLGADPSKIITAADSSYGFGEDYAKTISEGLDKEIKRLDPVSRESITGDIISSYISAVTPKIGFDESGKLEVTGDELLKAQKGKGLKDLLSAKRLFDPDYSKGIPKALLPKMDKTVLSSLAKKLSEDPSAVMEQMQEALLPMQDAPDIIRKLGEEDYGTMLEQLQKVDTPVESASAMQEAFLPMQDAPDIIGGELPMKDYLSSISKADVPPSFEFAPQRPKVPVALEDEFDMPWETAYTGQKYPGFSGSMLMQDPVETGSLAEATGLSDVGRDWKSPMPLPHETLELWKRLGLKFNKGGKVPDYRGGGTISDYFNMKGKSLGGSNKLSLAERLGRK